MLAPLGEHQPAPNSFDTAPDDGGVELVRPAVEYLASYRAALERAWSPDTLDPAAGRVELERIDADPAGFLAAQDDRKATGEPITLPDGSIVPRLPGYRRWIWDAEFAGVISFRWQPGTAALPQHVLGHVGYAASRGSVAAGTQPPRCASCWRRSTCWACPTSN